MKDKKYPVPVLMFHSIRPDCLITSHLSVPLNIFGRNMKAISKAGFVTVTLQNLHDYVQGIIKLPEKAIVLTFDDGNLDNWIYAYPILEKYGMKATLFPTLDFIGNGLAREPYYGDVENINLSELPPSTGSLRWSEILKMEKSGVFDIQSHTVSHTWLFSDESVVDFVNPNSKYYWISWNLNPEKKQLLMEETGTPYVPLGFPVFGNGRALGIRQFVPDERLVSQIVEFVRLAGGKDYFQRSDWRESLDKIVKDWKKNGFALGEYEEEKEYERRIKYELEHSKNIISKKLEKDVKFLCWPGGARTKEALRICSEIGYLASTYPSAERKNNVNIPGENSKGISRIGTCSAWCIKGNSNVSGWGNEKFFIASIMEYKGSLYAKIVKKFMKLGYLCKYAFQLSRKGITPSQKKHP